MLAEPVQNLHDGQISSILIGTPVEYANRIAIVSTQACRHLSLPSKLN
jgi:hypothetical protein